MATEEQLQHNTIQGLDGFDVTRASQRLTITNRTVGKLAFKLIKISSPTGDVAFTIRKVSDSSIISSKVWGDASTLPSSYPATAWQEVEFDTPTIINELAYISAEFSGGDGANQVAFALQSTDVKADEYKVYYDGSWKSQATYDAAYIYTYTTDAPTVTTQSMTSIITITATGHGNVTDLGDSDVTQHGHCWNEAGTPTTSDNKTENGAKTTTGAFTSILTGLIHSTLYRVRAYATNSNGTSYGNEVSFTTTSGASGQGGGVGGVGGVPSATGTSFPVGERLLVEERAISKPMAEAPMTDIETLAFNWLTRKGIEFQFQTSLMGGFYQLGGAVVDFLIPSRNLAWRIFGEYWHRGVVKEGSDILQRETLTAIGWTVVDLWGDDVKDRTDITLSLALEGREILR